jgi:hypothetical protein
MVLLDTIDDPPQEEADDEPEVRYPLLTIVGRDLLNLRVSDRSSYWIASSASLTERFRVGSGLGRDRLLVTEAITASLREYLEALFQDVVAAPSSSFLPLDELRDALGAENHQDLALGALVLADREVVIVIRGDLSRVVVPWSWFTPTPDGTAPDFDDVAVTDSGLAVRLGSYEASLDVILYEFDREYRARERQRRLEMDPSFGAALRRLRLQKGVPRSDFPGISEKEIARIERGEVERPHGSSLRAIAGRLGVDPAEIETY